ncbi:MAG: hypothetical protein L0H37_08325, partial [Nitrosospira sp.]|nr:hypothetical protein [Nitrosospira sp.]
MRKLLLTSIAGLAIGVFGFAGPMALAANSNTNTSTFESWDENNDGKITMDEFYGPTSDPGLYSSWDTNGDGLIDHKEWTFIGWDYDYDVWDFDNNGYLDAHELYVGLYTVYDTNKDKKLDKNEWNDARYMEFTTWDENGDDKITKDEFYGMASDWGVYPNWDDNHNGVIDSNEWSAIGWDYDFNKMDTDNNNYVDAGEVYDGMFIFYDTDKDGSWERVEWADFNEDTGLWHNR